MYDHKTFAGGVQARTVAGGTVQHPVVVMLDGVATELTLTDAMMLRDGLTAAVACVEAAEQAVASGDAGHHFTIGKTMHGMSSLPSKLPAYNEELARLRHEEDGCLSRIASIQRKLDGGSQAVTRDLLVHWQAELSKVQAKLIEAREQPRRA